MRTTSVPFTMMHPVASTPNVLFPSTVTIADDMVRLPSIRSVVRNTLGEDDGGDDTDEFVFVNVIIVVVDIVDIDVDVSVVVVVLANVDTIDTSLTMPLVLPPSRLIVVVAVDDDVTPLTSVLTVLVVESVFAIPVTMFNNA